MGARPRQGICLLLADIDSFSTCRGPDLPRPGPSICETCERHAACLVPAESSARNTIETVFCLRRNHISASALNATSQQMTNGRRVPVERDLPGSQKEAAMKRCAQCHGKLGLGVRSRNLWNGRWWIHVRYCSTHCEALHEVERRQRQTSLVHAILSPSSPQS